jgi:parallel beta-helix repeat protein
MNKIIVIGIIILFVGMGFTSISGNKINNQNIVKPSARGDILYVGGSGPGNYSKIQDAIDNSTDGDTVFVYNGIYYEKDIVINKSINLIGENRVSTIIDGDGIGDVIYISADWINISGFTIQNSGEGYHEKGVLLKSNYSTIEGNYILNNQIGIGLNYACGNNINDNVIILNNYSGINLVYSDSNTIIDNIVSDNGISGIRLDRYCNNNRILDNRVTLNEYEGIYLWWSCKNNIISGNIVLNNNFYGIYLGYYCDYTIISGNIVSDHYYGIYIFEFYNIISGNTVSDSFYGIRIYDVGGNNITGNNIITNNHYGIGLEGEYCNNNIIKGNNISNNQCGIELNWNASDNIITGNKLTNNDWIGIYLHFYSKSNNITGNTVSNSKYGFYLRNSYSNNIKGNNVLKNEFSFYLILSGRNNISGNNISKHYEFGIYIINDSHNNLIYHNNFIGNIDNAYDECNNKWDDGKYGNYWSDFKIKYPDAKPKLFKPWMWDSPYEIQGGNNTDNCPLVKEWPNSVSTDISRDKSTDNMLLLRILERFPLLERLYYLFRM